MVKKKIICKLTDMEDEVWRNAFADYVNEHGFGKKALKEADLVAFNKVKKRFRRLRKCDKIQ